MIFKTILAALVWVAGAPLALAQTDPVQAAFVVLGPGGAAQARVITTADACPAIRLDGADLAMTMRAPPQTLPLRPTRSKPEESKPSAFPVLACEAALPTGARQASVGGHPLPLPRAEPRRIVVIGDTGCRLKSADDAFQACNAPNQYPFAKVAAAAAAWKPDLIVHVGDYEYRENPCPIDKHPGCAASPWGYGWDSWREDFFAPAAPLLASAPLAPVRGNHEGCERAGQGWWRFIDPRPLIVGRDCNDPANDEAGDYSDPYAIPLGAGAQIVLIDTSNTSGAPIPPEDPKAAHYRDLYDKMAALAEAEPYTIVANHHPLLGFAAEVSKTTEQSALRPGNQGLQSAFAARNPWLFPPHVQMLLSGHVHVWEQVSFSSPHPTQFVAGFSGTQEDVVPIPAALPRNAYVAPGAAVEAFSAWIDGFGFMTLERTGPQTWAVEVHNQDGAVVNRCTVTGRRSACEAERVGLGR